MSIFPEAPGEEITVELIADARRGNSAALDDLFRRHHDHLLMAVRLRLGPRLRGVLESGDILQSVALEAFRELDGFEPRGQGSFRRFLNHLVLNKIRDRARHFEAQKRSGTEPLTPEHLEDAATAGTGNYLDPNGRFEQLEAEIRRLPDDLQEVLILRAVDGLPSAEVAQQLGKSDAAVRKMYSRGIAQLAMRLEDSQP